MGNKPGWQEEKRPEDALARRDAVKSRSRVTNEFLHPSWKNVNLSFIAACNDQTSVAQLVLLAGRRLSAHKRLTLVNDDVLASGPLNPDRLWDAAQVRSTGVMRLVDTLHSAGSLAGATTTFPGSCFNQLTSRGTEPRISGGVSELVPPK